MSSWIQRCKFDTPLLAAGSLIHFSHQQNGKLHILGNLIVTYKKKADSLIYRYQTMITKNLEVSVMLNEAVTKVLKNSMWDLATCANGEPNVVPVAFKDVTDDGRLVVGDVFRETT